VRNAVCGKALLFLGVEEQEGICKGLRGSRSTQLSTCEGMIGSDRQLSHDFTVGRR
jgi:hypothetical protein